MKFKDALTYRIGCAYFWLPCLLAIKLGFDGLCREFPCPVKKIFNDLLKI